MSELLAAADRWHAGNDDVVLVGAPSDPFLRECAALTFTSTLRNPNVVWLDPADARAASLLAASAAGKTAHAGAAFVCRNRSCSLPLRDAAAFARALA